MLPRLVLFLILILSQSKFAQQAQYFDAPFGGGIGYTPAWYVPGVDAINSELEQIGMPELPSSGLFSSGGAGFIYIGFVKNLRIGGMGFGGSTSVSQRVNAINREVVYCLGGGGLSVEYTLPFVKDFGISIGTVIGIGNLEIHLYRNRGSFSWDGTWEQFEDDEINPGDFSRKINNNFWMVTPTLNFDWPIYRFVILRIGVGYQITFNEDWTTDNDQELLDVPSDLSGNSFFIQSGIYIGFFSF